MYKTVIGLVVCAFVLSSSVDALPRKAPGPPPAPGKESGSNRPFSFALMGDTPYGDDKEAALDRMIADVNGDREIEFVLHAGDIKASDELCEDDVLRSRFDQFQSFDVPFVFTPGDNEWTDCHRPGDGGYLPTERLGFIRQLFFPNPGWTTGGDPMPVHTQADQSGFEPFVENTLFREGRVVFSQIHVVGSNNDLWPWDGIDPTDTFENPRPDRLAEFEHRNAAALAWLRYTFEVAAESPRTRGVFITMQANPKFETDRDADSRAGFNDFLDALAQEVEAFGRPVVLAHGDGHVFFIDLPWVVPSFANGDADSEADNFKIPNLTRIQTFGDTDNHWIKVVVHPKDEAVFRFIPQIVEGNL